MPEQLKTAPAVDTVTFTLDGKSLTVPKGQTVLQAALDQGIAIPYFCWHPKLKPVGACRMCYVEIEKMPKLMVSCATEATNGMIVHTNSDLVKRGRQGVLEFTLINHPLDCPTCDKGGECDLQDLTFAHGFDDSRFDFQKYRFLEEGVENTFDDLRIGPEIILNRNRCILCYKCVRANKEAFGEFDLGAYERGNITEINAAPGEQVDNPFSGNLVEICPVGALTNTDWRYKIRVWLTEKIESICPYTSSGTNIYFFRERHLNKIFRATSRRNDSIDDGWLGDVTRYGYQVATSPDRLQMPLVKKGNEQVAVSWDEALGIVARKFREIADTKGSMSIGGLTGPWLDCSALHSYNKLMRKILKTNNVDFRTEYKLSTRGTERHYNALASQPFKINDIDSSDVTVVFGSDLLKEHANEYLRLRKAVHFNNAAVFLLSPYATKSSDIARSEVVYKPGTEELVLNALSLLAVELGVAEGATKKSFGNSSAAELALAGGVELAQLQMIARALAEGRKITFIAGEIVTRSTARDTIAAALSNLALAFGIPRKGQIAILARHANSVGASRLGLLPGLSEPLAKELSTLWDGAPTLAGENTENMLSLMKKGELDALFVFGTNPVMLFPDRNYAVECLKTLDFLVVADLFETETTSLADVVLPMASWAEYAGRYVNLEGRIQKAQAGMRPLFQSKSPTEIIDALAQKFGVQLFSSSEAREREIDHVLSLPHQAPPPSSYETVQVHPENQPAEYTHALFVGDDPHHSGYLTERTVSLSSFVGEAYAEISQETAQRLKINDGDQVKVESEIGKVVLKAKISRFIEQNVVFIPRNFSAAQVNSLQSRKRRTDWVKLSRLSG